jgi:hypothetical protein
MLRQCEERARRLPDHLVGAQQQIAWNRKSEDVCGLAIDRQVVSRRLLDGQVPRPGSAQDPVDVKGAAAELLSGVPSITPPPGTNP